MDERTLNFYARNARDLAIRYNRSVKGVSDHFAEAFADCPRILDVGCGSGRDLCGLMQAGHDAFGVDASPEMLAETREICHDRGLAVEGRVFQDELPGLEDFGDDEFDGLLCSGVLMHVPERQMFDAVYALRRVLRPGGRLLVSIPARNDAVDPDTRRDPDGRLFTDLPPERLRLLLERVGFRCLWRKDSEDSLDRPSRKWATMLFTRSDQADGRPLDKVESVLNRDKKDATYKLALFRALAEIAQAGYNLAHYVDDTRVKIPIEAIARKWLEYYWPIFEHSRFMPQKHGESISCRKPLAFRKEMVRLIEFSRKTGGLSGFISAVQSGTLEPEAARLYAGVMAKIRQTVWNMPVRHAGGGEAFSVFQYDKADKTVIMAADMWRELCLTGCWIQDATILRWAELTARISGGTIRPSEAIDCLLSRPDPGRDVADARKVYGQLAEKHCVWTRKKIDRGLEIDHVIPFALWKNNHLWNLLPTLAAVNNQKRDRLPTQRLFRVRKDDVVRYWKAMRAEREERFDREAASLCGLTTMDRGNWENPLFTCVAEAIEVTAVQRGVARWEPQTAPVLVKLQPSPPATLLPFPSRVSGPRNIQARGRDVRVWGAEKGQAEVRPLFDFEDVTDDAFKRYLPLVAKLAAGSPFQGFEVGSLDWARDCRWIEVPAAIAGRKRFAVTVDGDSMEPTLHFGDLVVFEYHRNPRLENQIVIANISEFGIESSGQGVSAIKRLCQDADYWIFRSDNSAYNEIRVSKIDCRYPILGTMVAKIE